MAHSIIIIRVYLSRIFLEFSQNFISHHGHRKVSNLWCWDCWKIHLWVKNLNLFIFAHALKQKSPPGRRTTPISPKDHFLEISFFPAERGEDYEVEKMAKINFGRVFHWSQVLINSTIFTTFTLLVSVFCAIISIQHAEFWSFLT